MKKNYIAPSMKVRSFEGEDLMQTMGFTLGSNGTETQYVDPNNPGETVDGGQALGKYNAWGIWDPEDLQDDDKY